MTNVSVTESVTEMSNFTKIFGETSNIDTLAICLAFFVGLLVVYWIIKKIVEETGSFSDDSYEGRICKFDKPKKLYSKTFNKNKFKNFCGVEIECIQDRESLYYSDAKKLNFNKVGDSSLSEDGREFVSKPANGDRLFNMIDKICKVLSKKGYYIDKTCGLHVHIETPQNLELIKKLYLFYSKYESFFFKMLPSSRQKSEYCEKIRQTDNFSVKDVKDIKSLHQFKKKYYETNFYASNMNTKYYKKRRCWTNFHSLFYRGTLEIRSHSGTINSEKIKNWIIIHLSVMDFINNKTLEEIDALPVQKKLFMGIFPKDIRKYIESRWGKFKKTEEEYKCVKYK